MAAFAWIISLECTTCATCKQACTAQSHQSREHVIHAGWLIQIDSR